MPKLRRGTYQGFISHLSGEVRYLNEDTGSAYDDPDGRHHAWTFRERGEDGIWRTGDRWFRVDEPPAIGGPCSSGGSAGPAPGTRGFSAELAEAAGRDPNFGFKEDDGMTIWFLLMSGMGCAGALAAVVRVLSFATRAKDKGGKGYTEHSWREVSNGVERYESALYRHLNKVALGELVDDESGESHWAQQAM